jgi:hypothetical protein
MTSLRRALTDKANRYQSLSNFYHADVRRRCSREQDVGLWWRIGANGPLYRAAWVIDTGELYVTRLGRLQDGNGEVVVLGRARNRDQLEAVLDGWQDVCPQPDSMTWLRHRAAGLAPPQKPDPSLARAQASRDRGRGSGSVSRRWRRDAPSLAPRDSAVHPPHSSVRVNAGGRRPPRWTQSAQPLNAESAASRSSS